MVARKRTAEQVRSLRIRMAFAIVGLLLALASGFWLLEMNRQAPRQQLLATPAATLLAPPPSVFP
ncbi:MAG TPA: hypothetical protein VJ123_06590 [Anaerolineales bacterium]|nr:hypothetical protein [Anaerolineales bacterium]